MPTIQRLDRRAASRRALAAVTVAAVGAMAAACDRSSEPTGPPVVPVAAVSLSPDSLVIEVGQTRQLNAAVRDANGTELTGRQVAWTSSAHTVATVSPTGVVRAVGQGLATITAASEGRSAAVVIIVVPSFPTGFTWGTNLAGLGFGDMGSYDAQAPRGRYPQDYGEPDVASLGYFKARGMTVFRLPFNWERLQHCLGCELDKQYLALIDKVVYAAAAQGLWIILDLHNGGRYWDVSSRQWYGLGSEALPGSALSDVWRKLATRYKDNAAIYGYGLMNEPGDYSMGVDGAAKWRAIAQEVVNAIREVDQKKAILVAGYHWSSTRHWVQLSDGLQALADPGNNIIFEGHEYHVDHGATNANFNRTCEEARFTSQSIPQAFDSFIQWLRANGKKGIIGEHGSPATHQCWLDVLDETLAYIKANSDVLLSFQWWAAGRWHPLYPLSIEPLRGANGEFIDKPQMLVIEKHSRGGVPGPSGQ